MRSLVLGSLCVVNPRSRAAFRASPPHRNSQVCANRLPQVGQHSCGVHIPELAFAWPQALEKLMDS